MSEKSGARRGPIGEKPLVTAEYIATVVTLHLAVSAGGNVKAMTSLRIGVG